VEPAHSPTEIVRRERDQWLEGRREGARNSERELQRLGDSLEEARGRGRTLQQELDARQAELAEIDRARRAAELERDEFAGQVRKAQSEVMAKKVLEDEVNSLRSKARANDREVADLEIELDRKRRETALLRQRLADVGMDIPQDDPPYRPSASGEVTPEVAPELPPGLPPERPPERPPDAGPADERPIVNILTAGRDGARNPARAPPAGGPAGPSPVPPLPGRRVGAVRGSDVGEQPAPRRPGELPPPVLRRRSGFSRDPAQISRVRTRINELLRSNPAPNGSSYQVTRIDGVAADRIGGVIVLRYDAAGRRTDVVQARDLRITIDQGERRVEFDLTGAERLADNRRTPLGPDGSTLLVAQGDASSAWAASGLTMIRRR
jgi:hypothetical protein